jgi:hypothetical protein
MRVRLDRGAGSGFGEQLVKYVLGELSLPGRLICDRAGWRLSGGVTASPMLSIS